MSPTPRSGGGRGAEVAVGQDTVDVGQLPRKRTRTSWSWGQRSRCRATSLPCSDSLVLSGSSCGPRGAEPNIRTIVVPVHPHEHPRHASPPLVLTDVTRRLLEVWLAGLPPPSEPHSVPASSSSPTPATRTAIARRLCCRPATCANVAPLRRSRVAGLRDADRPGRPRRIAAEERARDRRSLCHPRALRLEVTEWSGRLLASCLIDSGKSPPSARRTVQRILAAQPQAASREYCKRASDPAFTVKMRPIIDLYLHPPADGPVWSIDEASIQALNIASPISRCDGRVSLPSARLSTSAMAPAA